MDEKPQKMIVAVVVLMVVLFFLGRMVFKNLPKVGKGGEAEPALKTTAQAYCDALLARNGNALVSLYDPMATQQFRAQQSQNFTNWYNQLLTQATNTGSCTAKIPGQEFCPINKLNLLMPSPGQFKEAPPCAHVVFELKPPGAPPDAQPLNYNVDFIKRTDAAPEGKWFALPLLVQELQ